MEGENGQEKPTMPLTPERMTLVKSFAQGMQEFPNLKDHHCTLMWVGDLIAYFGQYSDNIQVRDVISWLQNPEFQRVFNLENPRSETTPAAPSTSRNIVGNGAANDTDNRVSTTVNAFYRGTSSNVPKKRKKSELEVLLEENHYGVDHWGPRKRSKDKIDDMIRQ